MVILDDQGILPSWKTGNQFNREQAFYQIRLEPYSGWDSLWDCQWHKKATCMFAPKKSLLYSMSAHAREDPSAEKTQLLQKDSGIGCGV
jgi:hypothetical protein